MRHVVCYSMAALIGLSFIATYFDNSLASVFAFIPRHIFHDHYYPFNLVTYAFLERNAVLSGLWMAFLLTYGHELECAVGSVKLLQLIAFVIIATSLILMLVMSLLSGWVYVAMRTAFYGPWPILQAMAMAHCRLRSTSSPLCGCRRLAWLRVGHVPFALVLVAAVAGAGGYGYWFSNESSTHPPYDWMPFGPHAELTCFFTYVFDPLLPSLLAMWLSWFFLRYLTGDLPPAMAFHTFFYPAPLRYIVRLIGILCASLVSLLLRRSHKRDEDDEDQCVYRHYDEHKETWIEKTDSPSHHNGNHNGHCAVHEVSDGTDTQSSAKLLALLHLSAADTGSTLLPGSTEEKAERKRAVAKAALARCMRDGVATGKASDSLDIV